MEVENLLFGKEHPLPYGAMPSTSMMCSSSLGGRFGHSPTRSLGARRGVTRGITGGSFPSLPAIWNGYTLGYWRPGRAWGVTKSKTTGSKTGGRLYLLDLLTQALS